MLMLSVAFGGGNASVSRVFFRCALRCPPLVGWVNKVWTRVCVLLERYVLKMKNSSEGKATKMKMHTHT